MTGLIRRGVPVLLAVCALACPVAAFAQEPAGKTLTERAKEYWGKMISGLESTARSAGDEYARLKGEAAKATGPAREKLAAQMDVLSQKWSVARAKLTEGFEKHSASLAEDFQALKEKAAKATGPARERLNLEMDKLGDEWAVAKEKLSASWSSNMKAVGDEYHHLKGHAAEATAEAKAKLAPRMEKLKAEWESNRKKLNAYLEADLKQTKEDMAKLGAATSEAASKAKAALMKKYDDLMTRKQALDRDKSIDVIPSAPTP